MGFVVQSGCPSFGSVSDLDLGHGLRRGLHSSRAPVPVPGLPRQQKPRAAQISFRDVMDL